MNKLRIAFMLSFLSGVSIAQTKPNILWVTIEDTSPQFIGCYGNKYARTPVIDKLANEGVKFTNAFSTGTVCSPSRSTIITGVRSYKMGTGNHRSNYPIPDFIHGFPYYLKKSGYYVTNNSKTDYNVSNPDKFIEDTWNESSTKAGWWNRKPGQPFFAVFNFMDSHQSRTMTLSYQDYVKKVMNELPDNDRIGEGDFDMPPFYHDSPEMRHQFARVYNALKLTDNKVGQLLQRLDRDHLKDSTIIFFYSDHGEGIPRGKTNGINLGYRVPFVIWFPPVYKKLSPWGKAGVVTDEMINFEDLAPTIISLTGGNVPEHLKGRILMGDHRSKPTDHLMLSSDRSDNGIDMVRSITNGKYMYSRNYMPFMPEARYIRYMEVGDIKQLMRKDLADNKLNQLQKSLFADRPAEFLYDIENDQWETNNLVNDPRVTPVLKKMRNQLDDEILKSRDVMFLPEYEIRRISQNTTVYTYRSTDKNYPIKAIYQAASLSGFRGKDIALKQVKLLKSPNKIVRFWAITGLRSQAPEIIELFKTDIIDGMKDNYPPVAITASAISFNEFRNEIAKENLKRYSISENMDLALMCINYLLYLKDKEPFIDTIRSVREMNGRNYDVKAACLDFLGSLGLVPNTPNFEE